MKSGLVVGLLVAFGLALGGAYWQGKHAGQLDVRTVAAQSAKRAADSASAIATKAVLRVDTVLVRDLKRLPALAARVDTLRDSVLVNLTDTVQVIRYMAATDTAIKACRELANDCEVFRATAFAKFRADSASIRARDVLLALPKPRAHWGVGLSCGYGCNARGCGPTLNAGVVWRW